MSKNVIMPALGMAQETGTLIRWLKAPGETVTKGEPLMEIETDKATVEIEAPAAGVLAQVTAQPGDEVAVGKTIAVILAPGETSAAPQKPAPAARQPAAARVPASPIAARMAAEHGLDLALIKPAGGKIQKEDVLAYLAAQSAPAAASAAQPAVVSVRGLASPKARRLAQERGLDIRRVAGSGPEGAVLAEDVLAADSGGNGAATALADITGRGAVAALVAADEPDWDTPAPGAPAADTDSRGAVAAPEPQALPMARTWQVMAERLTQAWTSIPHFYLLRDVNATQLSAWRTEAQARAAAPLRITYTDLLIKVAAMALRQHARLNAAWHAERNSIVLNPQINIGLAVAIEDGLVVPVIHAADTLGLGAIAARRAELVARAQARKLAPADLSGGTFTISNLGMYGVDAFIAIVNPPQAAILSAGQIADRVVPVNGQPAVAPMLTLGLSCDHRVVDGARAAQFLQTLAQGLEAPLRLLD
jgi:pyruvate dehydrogenase E2 component (dihydrolipoamide acetyltransferase)